MDERQLAELFHDAADGGPPARFGHADVVAASRRATARRRTAIAGGTALGVAVLVGGIVVGGGYLRGTDGGGGAMTAGSGNAPSLLEDQQRGTLGSLAAPPSAVDKNVPEASAEQGRAASGKVVPWPGLRDGDARAGCGPMDRELVEQARELPAILSIDALGPPTDVPEQCPPDARSFALPVRGGMFYVVLAPVRGDGPPDGELRRDDGAVGYFVYTPKGAGLLALSVPAEAVPASLGGTTTPATPPLDADQVQRIAEELARLH